MKFELIPTVRGQVVVVMDELNESHVLTIVAGWIYVTPPLCSSAVGAAFYFSRAAFDAAATHVRAAPNWGLIIPMLWSSFVSCICVLAFWKLLTGDTPGKPFPAILAVFLLSDNSGLCPFLMWR